MSRAPTPPADAAPGRDAVTAAAAAVRATLGEPAPAAPRWPLWASTPGGCEPEAAAELAALGWRSVALPERSPAPAATALPRERGAVYGACDLAGVEATLAAARIPTRVTWLAAITRAASLAEIAAAVRDAPLWLPDAPFAVVAQRRGQHPFRSPDIAREAGTAVIDAHRARTGRRLPVDLDAPTTVVRVELAGDRLRIGCELTTGSRHRRADLPRRHRAGLSPAIAAALVALSGWGGEQRLLDPMCGAGTIAVEAARAARGQPPALRAGGRLDALGWRDAAAAADAALAVATARTATTPGPATTETAITTPRITAVDREGACCDDTRANLAAAGLADAVAVRRGDARRLHDLGDLTPVHAVVANPPYGLRQGRSRELASLYHAALASVARHLTPGGSVVWLTPAHRVARRAAEAAGLVPDGGRTIGLGTFDAVACRFVRPVA